MIGYVGTASLCCAMLLSSASATIPVVNDVNRRHVFTKTISSIISGDLSAEYTYSSANDGVGSTNGWLLLDLYIDNCTDPSAFVGTVGAVTEQCFLVDSINGTYNYASFSCYNDASPVVTTFSNTGSGCTGESIISRLNETCSGTNLSHQPNLKILPSCTQSPSNELPVNFTSVIRSTFSNSTCGSQNLSTFQALEASSCLSRTNTLQQNLCSDETINFFYYGEPIQNFPYLFALCNTFQNFIQGGSVFESYQLICYVNEPYIASYRNYDCQISSGFGNGTSLSPSCMTNGNSSGSSQFSCMGETSFSDTLLMNFEAKQTIDGCSASEFNSNPNYETVLKSAVATGMTGVSSGMIQDVFVVGAPTMTSPTFELRGFLSSGFTAKKMTPRGAAPASARDPPFPSIVAAATSSESFTVNYTVSVIFRGLGFSTANTAYSSLSSQLKLYVSSGQFTAMLQATATSGGNNATGFLHATSSSVATTCLDCPAILPTSAPVTASFSDDDEVAVTLSSGAVAGIVLAVLAVVAGGIGAIVYCCCCRVKEPQMQSEMAFAQPINSMTTKLNDSDNSHF